MSEEYFKIKKVSEKATASAVAFIGSIIFVVGKSPMNIMEPLLL